MTRSRIVRYHPHFMRTITLYRYALYALLLAILMAFLVWPIFLTVEGGFIDKVTQEDGSVTSSYTFRHIYDFSPDEGVQPVGVLQNPVMRAGLMNSLMIAVGTTLLCLLIALPLASLATRYDFVGKKLVTSTVLVPLILPPFVGAIGLKFLIGRGGAVNEVLRNLGLLADDHPGIDFLAGDLIPGLPGGRMLSVIVMEALHLYPILYLNVAAAMANLDPTLEEAALNLGASRWKRFFKLTLPLITPGIFAGGTIVFIWSFTELGTPLMFDFYEVTPVQIFFRIADMEASPQPYALTVVMLTVAIALYLLGRLLFGGKAHEMQAKASMASSTTKLGLLPGSLALGAFLLVTGLAILPHIGVVLSSFTVDGSWYRSVLPQALTTSHYAEALTDDMATTSIKNSLFLSLAAVLVCMVMGLAIAYLVVRAKVRGGFLLDSLAMLPLAVPGLVMAFGYVAMSFHWPFPGLRDWLQQGVADGDFNSFWYKTGSLFAVRGEAPNPFLFLIVAYAIRRLPYIVRSASAGLQQTSGSLEEAALNLGASTSTAIRRIVIPLIMANLIAGGILVFAFSMLEVSDSLILAQKQEHYPITKAIYEFFARLGSGPYVASAMGVWGMALLTVTMVGASVLMGKKLGAIFRV